MVFGKASGVMFILKQGQHVTRADPCLSCCQRAHFEASCTDSVLQGLECLEQLRVLDLSNNAIQILEGVDHLELLEDLWLNDNQLKDLQTLLQTLVKLKAHLSCLYLAGNPAADDDPSYKERLPHLLPCLQQLDSDAVAGR